MRKATLIGLPAGLSLLAAAPPPEAATGSRVPEPKETSPTDDRTDAQRRQAVGEFASCIVKNDRKEAAEIVLGQLTNEEVIKRYSRILDPDCLSTGSWITEMSLPGNLLQYALANALIQASSDIVVHDPKTLVPLHHRGIDESKYRPAAGKSFKPQQAAEKTKERIDALALVALSQFGECVVREAPTETGSLVRSKPGSPPENQALTSLMPAMSSCLDKGNQVSFSREVLRGVVAYNYYRLANAARSETQQVTKP